MLDTFLFDLDGTLLPLDMDLFIKIYFGEMGKDFSDIIDPKKLVDLIWEATGEMVRNTEYKTNEEVFMNKFSQLIEGDLDIYRKRFDAFYDNGFLKSRQAVFDHPMVRSSIELLKEKGYQLVIATNPIFPLKAILHRIQWAGLNADDFIYISSYERNHFCKPQVQFYQEVIEAIGKKPCQCMMVGNDVQEDLVAASLGMKTFLIDNYMIHRTQEEIITTYRGSYEDFYDFVSQLSPVATAVGK